MLKALLAATAPAVFATISARVHRELRLSGALVRRYLFALAREIDLPARASPPPPKPSSAENDWTPRRASTGFRLSEPVSERRPPGPPGPASCLDIEWALALQRVQALLAVMRRPEPLARRLAHLIARQTLPRLRELPVPAHVLRVIPPFLDTLLMRLDALARPDAWAGIDPESG